MQYFKLVLFLLIIFFIPLGCQPNNQGNIYTSLSNNNIGWQETSEQLPNGSQIGGNLRTFYFNKDGTFQVVCEASDASCLVGNNNTGNWDYITSNTVQVSIVNGPILFYTVVKIDAGDLWLQDNNNAKKPVLRQMVPFK